MCSAHDWLPIIHEVMGGIVLIVIVVCVFKYIFGGSS